jgi:hypothetical protein
LKKASVLALTFVLMVLALMLAGCGTTNLEGAVRFDVDSSVVKGAVVTLDGKQATTDESGNFQILDLPKDVLQGKVQIEGFPDFEFSVDLEDADDYYDLTIDIPAALATLYFIENFHGNNFVFEDNIEVFFNGHPLTITQLPADSLDDAGYETGVVPAGIHSVRVVSEIYEAFETEIELENGLNEISLNLDVTVEETFRRFNRANALHQYSYTYYYLHADTQALLNSATWASTFNLGAYVIDAESEMERLDRWESDLTGNTYENVVSFKRPYITEYRGERIASNDTQHWVRIGSIWYIVHAERFW